MNDDNKIEVIWVQPMREAQVIEIGNDLESMQELVGGYIEEYMPFEDEVAIVCNEEGKLMGLAPNRAIYDQDGHMQEVICGSFFICHATVCSLTSPVSERVVRNTKLFGSFSDANIVRKLNCLNLKVLVVTHNSSSLMIYYHHLVSLSTGLKC